VVGPWGSRRGDTIVMHLTQLLAQNDSSGGGLATVIVLLIELALIVLMVAGMWLTFAKAGKPGWAAIIPIYNVIVLLQIVGKPIWWILLFLIPIVNFIISIVVMVELAKVFGKGIAFAIGLVFLPFIFILILGFGDAKYLGPAAR
jgi:hypothetical protein